MSYLSRRLPCRLGNRFARPIPASITTSITTPTARAAQAARKAPIPVERLASVYLFSTNHALRKDQYEEQARKLNQKGLDQQEQEIRVKENQLRRPWHRQDVDKPPAEKGPLEDMPTKGKLLTTPTRLLKLIVPLPIHVEKDQGNNSRDFARSLSSNDQIQPLALLVHPQQPLSYVERLIQAELPPVLENGKEKIPNIYFRAEDSAGDSSPTTKAEARNKDADKGQKHKESGLSDNHHVASYSGLGHEAEDKDTVSESEKRWVRWSSSTEMGDFIRDAARGREFAIEVEGYNLEMRVSVPSFNDRTYYMRMRLRRMSKQIDHLASIKKECDELAHKSAHRLAQGGFAALASWWGVVYYVTFETEAGWDLVEPVTYLVGLSTIMGGYLWFLYISKDLSYKAAMNITVSRRQNALYEAKGFDMQRWEQLVQEANAMRREIKTVAAEYDVDWDEMKDLAYSTQVKKVLEKERHKSRNDKDEEEEDEDDEAEAREEESRVKQEMVQGNAKRE